jgi:DNA-binding CsgD family transcriptional regulator
MRSATAADLRRVLQYAESTVEVGDFGAVGPVVLRGLAELVGADVAILQEIDLSAGPRMVAVGWPAERLTLRHAAQYAPLVSSHPLVQKCSVLSVEQALAAAPLRVSDLLSRREWRANPVFQQSECCLEDEMRLIVGARGPLRRGIWLGRDGKPFTDRERDLLTLASRHVAFAIRRARRHRHQGLQILPGPAWVLLQPPAPATPNRPAPGPAAQPAGSGSAGSVPGSGSAGSGSVPGSGWPVGSGSSGSRSVPGSGPLSGRELQVLGLVARGLTDAQLARRLEISPRTAGKHLERVYAKLAVPNRAAAVAWWASRPAGASPGDDVASRVMSSQAG